VGDHPGQGSSTAIVAQESQTSPAALSVSFVLLGYIARLLFNEPIRVSGSLAASILDAKVVVCEEPITNSGRWLAAWNYLEPRPLCLPPGVFVVRVALRNLTGGRKCVEPIHNSLTSRDTLRFMLQISPPPAALLVGYAVIIGSRSVTDPSACRP
jgi:hypothetical protein